MPRTDPRSAGAGPPPWRTLLLAGPALLAALLWLLVTLDHKAAAVVGVHVIHPYVLRVLVREGTFRDLALGRATYLSAALAVAVVAVVHFAVLAVLQRQLRRRRVLAGFVLAALAAPVAALFAGGGALTAEAVTALGRMVLPGGSSHAPPVLAYPRPGLAEPTLARRASVILFVSDSLRGDAWGPESMPELWNAVKQREGSAWALPRHYSGGHETFGGLFSILYGLNSYYLPLVERAGTPSWPLQVLRRHGYFLLAATASPLDRQGAARAWLGRFDRTREFTVHGDYRDDRELVDWFVAAADDGRIPKPFFALVFLNSTHHNYSFPERFAVHQPTLPESYDHFMGDHKLSRLREEIRNRYRNSVLWVDHLLAGAVRALRPGIDRGDLVVLVTGDHGEELFDHGLLGHYASHLVDARIRVPLLLFGSKLPAAPRCVTSHTDLMPTLLDLLEARPRPDPALYSDGISLAASQPDLDRVVVVSAADRELGDLKLALVARDRKLVIDAYGLGDRFDLREEADPEDRPLPGARDQRTLDELTPELRRRLYRFVTEAPAKE